jgi:hypothetical protein
MWVQKGISLDSYFRNVSGVGLVGGGGGGASVFLGTQHSKSPDLFFVVVYWGELPCFMPTHIFSVDISHEASSMKENHRSQGQNFMDVTEEVQLSDQSSGGVRSETWVLPVTPGRPGQCMPPSSTC